MLWFFSFSPGLPNAGHQSHPCSCGCDISAKTSVCNINVFLFSFLAHVREKECNGCLDVAAVAAKLVTAARAEASRIVLHEVRGADSCTDPKVKSVGVTAALCLPAG